MSERPWYKRYPSDFIAGTLALSLEEKGAYSMVLDLIYDRGGPIPDDPQWIARVCGCSTRKWKTIRNTLVEAGKLVERDGLLTNLKAEKNAENNAKEGRKLSESGVKGGEKTAEKRRQTPDNNDLGEKGPEKTGRHTRDQRPETRKKSLPPISPQADELVFKELFDGWLPVEMAKGNRGKALEAWRKHVSDPELVLRQAVAYCAACCQTRTKTQYVVTWLNQHGWDDNHHPPPNVGVMVDDALMEQARQADEADERKANGSDTTGDHGSGGQAARGRLPAPTGQSENPGRVRGNGDPASGHDP